MAGRKPDRRNQRNPSRSFSFRMVATWSRDFPSSFLLSLIVLCRPALANVKLSYKIPSKPLYGPDTVCSYRAHLSSRYRARSDTRQIIVSVCFLIEDRNAQIHWNQSPSHSCDNLWIILSIFYSCMRLSTETLNAENLRISSFDRYLGCE